MTAPRLTRMRLVDPSHKLPMPGHARFFAAEGETVDLADPHWLHRHADGSIEPVPDASEPDRESRDQEQPDQERHDERQHSPLDDIRHALAD